MSDGMKLMIDEAEKAGKWLFCQYQAMWFSPKELREHQAAGRFRWGPVNWQIRDPKEHMEQLEREAQQAAKDRDNFRAKLKEN